MSKKHAESWLSEKDFVKNSFLSESLLPKRLKSGPKFQTHQFDKESLKNAHKALKIQKISGEVPQTT